MKINSRLNHLPQRNEPCLCGSGKKFKKCCMDNAANAASRQNDDFPAIIDAAQAAVRNRDFVAAESLYRAAVRQQKTSAAALFGLGQCLCQLNRSREGIPLICQAGKLTLKPAKQSRDIKYLLDIAYELTCRHAPEEAMLLAKAGLKINAASANAYHIIAMSLQSLNKHAEAYAYSLRAAELAPDDANALIQLAVLETKLGRLREARRNLEQAAGKAAGANQARAHLELGVLLDKLGEYDNAFTHLAKSGQIASQSPAARGMDRQAVYREIGGFKAEFDARFLQTAADSLPDDGLPPPVFLIGFFRSGTTLAEQILAAHDRVMTSDETNLIAPVLNELYKITPPELSLPERIKSLGKTEIALLRGLYWRAAAQALGAQVMDKVLVDKTALNIINIELINALFPNALLIFAIRDPRDVCLSCFMQPFSPSPLTVNFLGWTDTARFYALIMDYWLTIRDNLSLQYIQLRYEDVLNDMEGQFRPIFAKMGLQWSDECAEFYRHSQRKIIKTPSFDQVSRPLYTSSVQRWRNYAAHFAEIQPVLDPYLAAFGYDTA